MSLAFATAAVHGQDLPTYQSTVGRPKSVLLQQSGQFPGAFGAPEHSSYRQRALASAAITMATPMMQPFLRTPPLNFPLLLETISLANSGTSVSAIGSLSLLFYTPNTNGNAATTTRYIFSNGDSSPNEFYLKMLGTNTLVLGQGTRPSPTRCPSSSHVYYFASTWNFTSSNSGPFGINYYLGAAGQPTTLSRLF